MKTKAVSPTGSYWIDIPVNATEKEDGDLISVWVQGESPVLQLSSKRCSGEVLGAEQRMREMLATSPLQGIQPVELECRWCHDFYAASGHDDLNWIYFYAVWQDLVLLATVNWKGRSLEWLVANRHWTLAALDSVRREMHPVA